MEIDECLLSSALQALSEMSVDTFEAACQKAGHNPIKHSNSFQMTQTQDCDMTAKYVECNE
jgi:predicted HicB family RNase H-like nuclease